MCAELSTSEKISTKLTIFHREAYTIFGSRLEKRAQVLIDLSKNIFLFGMEVNFLFLTTISIDFYHSLLPFITDHW